jgi:hypothetical protein
MTMRTLNTTGLVIAITLVINAPSVDAADVAEIEHRRLFAPTESELNAEDAGQIYIYDGLRDRDIERALEQHFNRIENMMFIRTIKTDEKGAIKRDTATGEIEIEDDGC